MTGNPKDNGSWACPAPALAFSERMSDPGYSGEVQRLGPDWRLVVSMDAARYVLQMRVDMAGRYGWVSAGGRCPASPAAILAKFGAMVPGLAGALAALPDDPADALPDFRDARAAQLALLADVRRLQRQRRADKVAAFFDASKDDRAFARSAVPEE